MDAQNLPPVIGTCCYCGLSLYEGSAVARLVPLLPAGCVVAHIGCEREHQRAGR